MKNKTTVKFSMKAGYEDLIPKKAHHDDAAFDLRSRVDIDLIPGRSLLVPTGIFIELPINFEAQIRPRSGLALKHDLTLTNSPGTIDAGYRGEVGIIMYNHGKKLLRLSVGKELLRW
jgi:dUTP pyrophosphatase